MMTLYLVFSALQRGDINLSTRLSVSANAAAQPPSKLGVRAGQTISVEDAILALVTRSANDVAMVIAENLGGSQARFAEMMTATARSIGMSRTVFRNPHGLPDAGQYTTARDMATLGLALQQRFPAFYGYFATRSFVYNGTRITGHNRLLGRVAGVDGIKTGYTRASGYNLVTSVHHEDRYLVAVVLGGRSAASRDAHMVSLIERYLPGASRGPRTAPALVAAAAPAPAGPVAVPNMPTPRARPQLTDPVTVAAVTPVPPAPAPAAAPVAAQVVAEAAPAAAAPVQLAAAAPAAEPDDAEGDTDDIGSFAPPAVANTWKIQIGAFPTEESASATLDRAQNGVQILASLQPYTEPVIKGNTTLYRARFAGFDSKEAARAACASLERRNFACLALR
jgi:D-alanyl-D-alanine carboxypeptidase